MRLRKRKVPDRTLLDFVMVCSPPELSPSSIRFRKDRSGTVEHDDIVEGAAYLDPGNS